MLELKNKIEQLQKNLIKNKLYLSNDQKKEIINKLEFLRGLLKGLKNI
jgi:hypothetical protein